MKFLVGVFIGALLGILSLLAAAGLFIFGVYLGVQAEKGEKDDVEVYDPPRPMGEDPETDEMVFTSGRGQTRTVPGPIPDEDPDKVDDFTSN